GGGGQGVGPEEGRPGGRRRAAGGPRWGGEEGEAEAALPVPQGGGDRGRHQHRRGRGAGAGGADGVAGPVPGRRPGEGDDEGVRGGQGAAGAAVRALGGGVGAELRLA